MSRTSIPSGLLADPVRVAWRSLSDPVDAPEPAQEGSCARCGVIGSVVPLKDVVSDNFTGWEAFDPDATGLCVSCAWGFTPVDLRTKPVIVHAEKGAVWAAPEDVLSLVCQPLPPEIALSVPVAGKKHLLPYAEWGAVVSDGGALPWGPEAAELARTITELRIMGVRENEFPAPAAPYRVVIAAVADTDATIRLLTAWERLHPWQAGPHFPVAVRATRHATSQINAAIAAAVEKETPVPGTDEPEETHD